MTSISSLQSIVNGTASTTNATADAVAEAEDRFLKLLITQMQNQDPLNPLDNAQITSQMAQLSTVSGINKLNASLEALQADLQSSQSLQMAGLIGRGVMVSGSTVALYSSTNSSGETSMQGVLGANLSNAADSVTVTVKDASGNEVYSTDLGNQSAGIMTYVWNGQTNAGDTASAGKYTFNISATSGGENVALSPLSFGEVLSVTNGASGIELNVDTLGAISTADIVQIY